MKILEGADKVSKVDNMVAGLWIGDWDWPPVDTTALLSNGSNKLVRVRCYG